MNISERLADLRREQDACRQQLAQLDAQRQQVMTNFLRIDGAIQILTELEAAEKLKTGE